MPQNPAARIVIEAKRTEREIELQAELDAEKGRHAATNQARIDREKRIAELEDQLHQLKQIQRVEPKPAKKKPGAASWTLIGAASEQD
jgi:hypothetical protein